MLLRISRRQSMWRKLPGGIKSDPRPPKLSNNSRAFQPWFKSAHQFLRRCSEHRAAPHFLIKKRNQSTNRTIELLPDGLHVLFLHLNLIAHKLRHVLTQGGFVQQHVNDHTTHRNAEVMEPTDESSDYRDRQHFGQGNEEKGRLLFVG